MDFVQAFLAGIYEGDDAGGSCAFSQHQWLVRRSNARGLGSASEWSDCRAVDMYDKAWVER